MRHLMAVLLFVPLLVHCQRARNSLNDQILACGTEVKSMPPGTRFVPLQGITDPDQVRAVLLSEDGRQTPMELTSRACVVVPDSGLAHGWLVAKNLLSPNELASTAIADLDAGRALAFQPIVRSEKMAECPISPGFDTFYTRSDRTVWNLEAKDSVYRYSYHLRRAAAMDGIPVRLGLLAGSLHLNLQGLEPGEYRAELVTYDISRFPESPIVSRQLCRLQLDDAAPEAIRTRDSPSLVIGPGEMVALRAKEDSPYKVRLCWQEGFADNCRLVEQDATFTRAPQTGDWTLSYQFEDSAGNASPRINERYSVVVQGNLDAIEDSMNLYALAMDNADTLSALMHLTAAVKTKNSLQSQAERDAVKQNFVASFVKLGLTDVAQNKIMLEELQRLFPTTAGYLVRSYEDTDTLVLKRLSASGEVLETKRFRAEIEGHSLFNSEVQELIESSTKDGFIIYDNQLKQLETIALPKGQSCSTARFDARNRRILLTCPTRTSPNDPVYVYDRTRAADGWRRLDRNLEGGFSDTLFIGDGSHFIMRQFDEGRSYLYATSDPNQLLAEWEGLVEKELISWKHWSCHKAGFSLRCFDLSRPTQDLLALPDVATIIPAPEQRFVAVVRQDQTITMIDMENPALNWPLASSSIRSLVVPSNFRETFFYQDSTGHLMAASPGQSAAKALYTVSRSFNDIEEIPQFMSTSTACELSFYRLADQVIVVGLDANGDVLPYQAFKVADAANANCINTNGEKRIAITNKSGSVFIFTKERSFAIRSALSLRLDWASDSISSKPRIVGSKGGQLLGLSSQYEEFYTPLTTPECNSCVTLIDRYYSDSHAVLDKNIVMIFEVGHPALRVELSETLVSGVFASPRALVVADKKGGLHAIDRSTGQIVGHFHDPEGKFIQFVPLQSGDFLAALSRHPADRRITILQTDRLTKITDFSGLTARHDNRWNAVIMQGGPFDSAFLLFNDQQEIQTFPVQDLIQGVTQPLVFDSGQKILNVVWSEKEQRILGFAEGSFFTSDRTGVDLQTIPVSMSSSWAFSQKAQAVFAIDSFNRSFSIASREPQFVTKDLSMHRFLALGVVNEILHAVGGGKLFSIPLDEAKLVARSCEWLKDYLAYGTGLSDRQRKICE